MSKPFYNHDCDQCHFLGTYSIQKNSLFEGNYDLYWCPQHGIPTVVVRWSDEGPDYSSGMPTDSIFFDRYPIFPAHEAYRRAKILGYTVGKLEPTDTTILLHPEKN